MKGFLEFGYGPYVIVRIGHEVEKHGDPYLWACVCPIDGDTAEPIGFSTTPLKPGVISALRRLMATAQLKIKWTRMKDRPYLMRETTGASGEMRMSKHGIPHVKEAKNADGSPNWGNIMSTMAKLMHCHGGGRISFKDFTVDEVDLGNGDFKVTASVTRHEN